MFREMRRKNQKLSPEDCDAILRSATSGVLAVSGDDGYPYAVPVSFVWDNSKIYFHCANTGHKLDGIGRNEKVSFCVIGSDRVIPEEYTTYFQSVILFGRAEVVTVPAEKRAALAKLAEKYSPGLEEGRNREVEAQWERVCIVKINVEHLTGKESIELTRARK